ncbi:MAG TPA: RagB/SusD family nutrient uptake outer membrane protein, partial [Parapedobacter sp.]|nr:RagB/SusD family nutrient uptake outer membrane protein [Parapedobacter sp.]
MKNIFHWTLRLILLTNLFACNSMLEEIPDRKLATPNSVKALRAMMDEDFAINGSSNGLGESSTDDYYLTTQDYEAIGLNQRNLYTWQSDIGSEDAYMVMYRKINIANIVLESLTDIRNATPQELTTLKGEALFVRANTLLALAAVYTKPYLEEQATQEFGLILRKSSDFNVPSYRSTLKETYDYIESDLLEASRLLPMESAHVHRANRLAAFSLMSRLHLIKSDYEAAERYADSVLANRNSLLDYNTLDSTLRYPMPPFNHEIIYHTQGANGFTFSARAKIDTLLFDSYAPNDRRRTLFFFTNTDGSKRFKGSYVGGEQRFSGLALDEIYLTKAECLARGGKVSQAMDTLNQLLSKRYRLGFTAEVADDATEALDIIL